MKTRFLPLQAPDSLSLAAAAIFWPDVVPTWSFGTPIEYGLPATVASMVMSGTLAAWVAASSAGVPGCAPTAARPLTDIVWKDVASFSYLSFTSSSAKVRAREAGAATPTALRPPRDVAMLIPFLLT